MSRTPARRAGPSGRAKAGGTSRTARIGGMEITYDDGLDEHLRSRVKPSPLFPQYHPAEPRSLNKTEQEEVALFLRLRDRFRDGPLYAAIGKSSDAPEFNPFEGMGAYSQKYIKRARTLPRLNTKARAPSQFPRELWRIVDPSRTVSNGMNKPRPAMARSLISLDPLKLQTVDEDEDAEENMDDEGQEQEIDDQYDDSEEDDMAADYNAEQYFDNGGDEAGDDLELDDGDGGDAFN